MVDWLFSFLEVRHVRYVVESNGKLQLIGIINSVRKISVKKADLHRIFETFLLARERRKGSICGRSAKSNKLFKSPNWRICDLRNLFADYPLLKNGIDPQPYCEKLYSPRRVGGKREHFSSADTDATSYRAANWTVHPEARLVSGFFNYRVSRNYSRKCSQLRVITKALNVLKSSKLRCRDMRNFVITTSQ